MIQPLRESLSIMEARPGKSSRSITIRLTLPGTHFHPTPDLFIFPDSLQALVYPKPQIRAATSAQLHLALAPV